MASKSAPKPKSATLSKQASEGPDDVVEAGLVQKYPSTAPTPVEEAAKLDAKAAEDDKGKLTNSQRLERLEMALTTGMNIDLNQFKVPK